MKLVIILGLMFGLLLASLPVAFSLGSLGLGLLVTGGFSPLRPSARREAAIAARIQR